MTEWLGVMQTLGFPVFVTLWFMFRLEKVLNKNTETLKELTEKIIEAMK